MNHPLKLHGLVAAAHTPFHSSGAVNPAAVDAQASHLAAQQIRFAFITGSTGESSSLQLAERKELYAAWNEAGQRHGIGVIAHTGSNSIADSCELAALAQQLGFVATSSLCPSYYKPATPALLVDCCAQTAAAAPELPYYFYDIPVLTGVRFNPVVFMELAKARIPNFAGIKFTNPDLGLYLEALNHDPGLDLPWGVDEWFLAALATGARGAVGSSFNFAPALYQRLINAFESGDINLARELQLCSVRMINILASHGYMAAAKTVMGWQGVDLGPARLPLPNLDSAASTQLRDQLDAIGFFTWALN